MAKQEQILNIDPATELKFVGPFNVISSTYLKLSNPTDNHVLFKIKTTAPKKYCVRPNSGLVEPKATVHVQVCLQPFVFDPNEKNKHKFMVQTLLWNPKGELSQDDAWKEAKAEQLMDTKLKCVFELTADSGPAKKAPAAGTTQAALSSDNENARYVGGDSGNNDDTLLSKTRREMEHLQDEESHLRDENDALKEELRLMKSKLDAAKQSPYWNQNQVQAGSQHSLILLAVVAAVLGIVLGKFLL